MFEGIIDVRDHGQTTTAATCGTWPTESDDTVWAARVSRALATGGLRVAYQPVIDLRSARVSHHEALVRMVPAGAGGGPVIAASSFMPAAERSGLGPAVDLWVVSQAADLLRRALDQGRTLRLAVNLSATTASDAVHMAAIAGMIRHRRIDPGSLEFEITETIAMDCSRSARDGVSRLREMGCQFALDDFGTGYSSLSVVRDLPVDRIKIDRSFIRRLRRDPVSVVVVRAVVELARVLGCTTVAEGVETRADLRAVRELGVDLVQGWLAGRPAASPIGSGLG